MNPEEYIILELVHSCPIFHPYLLNFCMITEVVHYEMKKKILEISKLQVLECELCQLGNMLNPLFPRELNHDVTLFFHSLILLSFRNFVHLYIFL